MFTNFVDLMQQGQVYISAAKEVDFHLEKIEGVIKRVASPIGLSVGIATLPLVESAAPEVKNFVEKFFNQPSVEEQFSPTYEIKEELTVITAQRENTESQPFQSEAEVEYAPGLWNLISTGSGDMVQTYLFCSPTERYFHEIQIPPVQEMEQSLFPKNAPSAFLSVTIR